MKNFIEALKKHGYEETAESPENYWYVWSEGVANGILIYNDDLYKGENPELAFWCLDEIRRLGWSWDMGTGEEFMGATNPNDVEIELMKSGHRRMSVTHKTKAAACRNALIAVLESAAEKS